MVRARRAVLRSLQAGVRSARHGYQRVRPIGPTGDGGPATLALLNGPMCARVRPSDGAVVIIDVFQNYRFRAVHRNKTITTIAGDGHYGMCAPSFPGPHTRLGVSTVATPHPAPSLRFLS